DRNDRRRIALQNGRLKMLETGQRLTPVGDSRFLLVGDDGRPSDPSDHVSFEPEGTSGMRLRYEPGGSARGFSAHRYDPTLPASVDDLAPLVGRYWSDELETTYTFAISGGRFTLQMGNGRPAALFPKPDDPRAEWDSKDKLWIGYGMIAFRRNEKGEV